ncbi:MAG: PadR family transcriptional regulator [Vicinamibacterales bacterium]
MPPTPLSLPQGTLDLLILRTLAAGASHGYAIARTIEETTDDALRIEEGSLYPALHRMQQRRWISAEWRQSELGKKVKIYALTTRGRAELRARVDDWGQLTDAVGKVLRMG